VTEHRSPAPSTLRLKLAILLTVLAFAEFLVRGPVLAMHKQGNDMAAPYIAAIRLMHHQDPYKYPGVLEEWVARGADPGIGLDASAQRPIYPPTALPLFFPLALFRWVAARALYVLLCTALYTLLVLRFSALVNTTWHSSRRWFFLAFALGLAPMHTAIRLANPSAITCILFLLSLLLAHEENDAGAALLLALCLCIKPTIGPPALLFFLLGKRWKLLSLCAGFVAAISLFTLAFLAPVGRVWLLHLRENTTYLFSYDGAASFFGPNPACINLQMPFYAIFHSIPLANVLAWTTASLLALWWLMILRKSHAHDPQKSWLLLSAISLIGLLPIYQRTYNTGIILLALLFVFRHPKSFQARAVLALSTVFLLPIHTILVMNVAFHIPHAFRLSKLWVAGFLCLEPWIIVAIVILLLHAASQWTRRLRT
jgi:hypothetical protein